MVVIWHIAELFISLLLCSPAATTSPPWTPQQCMSWAAWLASAGPPCPAGAPSAQTVTSSSARIPLSPPANQAGATAQGQPAVPRLWNASGQWMPSCSLPRSTESSTHRCILGRTTGAVQSVLGFSLYLFSLLYLSKFKWLISMWPATGSLIHSIQSEHETYSRVIWLKRIIIE